MGLLAEIQSQTSRRGTACTMALALTKMNAKDKTELAEAMADTSIPHVAIFRALKARTLPVTETGVVRHRKGECACGKS